MSPVLLTDQCKINPYDIVTQSYLHTPQGSFYVCM